LKCKFLKQDNNALKSIDKNSEGTDKNSQGMDKNLKGYQFKPTTNNPSIKDPSTKTINNVLLKGRFSH